MNDKYAIIECFVEYNDGSTEMRRPTVEEVFGSIGDRKIFSAIDYLKVNLKNVKSIRVNDVLYFKTEEEYNKYIKGTK